MSKRKSLQPWLDYFDLLHTYEQKGYLEVKPDKHEAYITRAALYTLSPAPPLLKRECVVTNFFDVACRLRTYAAYLSTVKAGEDVMAPPELRKHIEPSFALHVVKEEPPHDLLYTLLFTRRRVWWKLWMKAEQIEVITYNYNK